MDDDLSYLLSSDMTNVPEGAESPLRGVRTDDDLVRLALQSAQGVPDRDYTLGSDRSLAMPAPDENAIQIARAAYSPDRTAVPGRDFTLGSDRSMAFNAADPFEERAGETFNYKTERPTESIADRALRMVNAQNAARTASAPAAAPAKQEQGFFQRVFGGEAMQSNGRPVIEGGQINWGDPQNPADFFRADKAMQELMKGVKTSAPAAPAAGGTTPKGVTAYAPQDDSAMGKSPAMAAIGRQVPGEGEMRRPFFDIPFIAGDLSKQSNYARAAEPLKNVNGIIFHHTAGRGRPEDIVNVLNQRGLGVQYIMDRDGSIYQALPNGARGAHMMPSPNAPVDNSNAIGVEMIARDNDDVTPAQVEAAKRLFGTLREQYPQLQAYGHGEVNRHKQSTEGMAAVGAIRSAFDLQPQFKTVSRAAPPMAGRTLRGYQTGDYAEGGRIPLLEDQYPTHYLPHIGRQVMQDGGTPEDVVTLARQVVAGDDEPSSEGTSIIENTPPVVDAMGSVAMPGSGMQAKEPSLEAYEPTLKERIFGLIAGTDEARPSPERRRFAEGITNLIPGISLQDAGRALSVGQYGKAAEETVNALPAVSAPRAASAALPAVSESLVAKSILPTGIKYEPFKNLPAPSQDELARMYLTAERIKPDFDAVNRKIAESVGGEWHGAGLKGSPRAIEKSIDDYDGDVTNLKDLVRGTIIVNSVDDVPRVIEAVGRQYPIEKKGFRNLLDRSVTPEDGYRDAKMNVVVDGQKTELQITTPELAAAKDRAHELYKQRRTIEGAAARGNRPATPEEAAEIDYLNKMMKQTYEDAWARSLERTSRTSSLNAASEMGAPLRRAESGEKRRGGSLSQATQYDGGSSAAMVTGIPSTSKNLVRDENFIGHRLQSNNVHEHSSTKTPKREGGIVDSALKISSQFGPGAAQEAVRSLKQQPGRR